jgi:predicted RNase H-like HicB family nuclease
MTTKLTYRVTARDGRYVASCEELPVEAVADSPQEAIARLKKAAELRLDSVEAVGPPSRPPPSTSIELVARDEPERDPQGPGDSPAAEDVERCVHKADSR